MALKIGPTSTGPSWIIHRGATFTFGPFVVVDFDGVPRSLVGCAVRLLIGRSLYKVPQFEANIGTGVVVTDAPNGELKVELSAPQTAAFEEGGIAYELLIIDSGGAVILQLKGGGEVVRTLTGNLGDETLEQIPDGFAGLVGERPAVSGAISETEAVLTRDPARTPAADVVGLRPLKPLLDAKADAAGTAAALAAKADAAATTAALATKAPLASPALTGAPTAPTPATSDNSTRIATTALVKAALAELVASSPAALDTLNELAAALGNDANFAATMTAALAAKQDATLAPGALGPGSVERSVVDVLAGLVGIAGQIAELSIDGLAGTATIDGEAVSLSSLFTDTHAAQLIMPSASGAPVVKAPNVLCREPGVGFLSAPVATELVPAADAASSFTTGTAAVAADQSGPDGTANKAFTVTDSSAVAQQGLQRNQTISADSITRAASLFVKKAASASTVFSGLAIGYAGGTAIAGTAAFDPYTGQLYATTGTLSGWEVEDAGTFWKVTRVIANNGTNTTFYLAFYPTYSSASDPGSSVPSLTGSWVCAWGNMRALDMPAPPILAGGAAGGNIQKAVWDGLAGGAIGGWVTLDNRHHGSGSPILLALSVDGVAADVTCLRLIKSGANLLLELVINSASVATVTVGKWRTGRQCIAFLASQGYMIARYVRVGAAAVAATPSAFQNFNALSFGGDTITGAGRAYILTEKCKLRKFSTANQVVFSGIFSDAIASFDAIPAFWDNFDRGDGIIGVSPSGHAYQTVVASGAKVTPYLSGGRLVCDASGGVSTAAYSAVDMMTAPSRIRAAVSFPSAGTSGAVGLITSKIFDAANINYIVVTGSVHLVWTDKLLQVGIYANNILSVLNNIEYPTPMKMDGTIYEIGVDLDVANSSVSVIYPSGPPITIQDSRIAQYAGRYVTYEHFASQQSYILPNIHYIDAS